MMESNSLVVLLFTTVLCLFVAAVWRVYFNPLSQFPGLKWAALTLWNEFYWNVVKQGTFIWKIEEMHEILCVSFQRWRNLLLKSARSYRPDQSLWDSHPWSWVLRWTLHEEQTGQVRAVDKASRSRRQYLCDSSPWLASPTTKCSSSIFLCPLRIAARNSHPE